MVEGSFYAFIIGTLVGFSEAVCHPSDRFKDTQTNREHCISSEFSCFSNLT